MSKKYLMSKLEKQLYVLDQIQGENITYNIPLILKFKTWFKYEQLKTALELLVSRHEILRTHFSNSEMKFYQIIEEKGLIDFDLSYVDKSALNLESVIKEFIRPFSLSEIPLFRVKIINIADSDESIFMMDIHHIICDGMSMQLMLNELFSTYKGNRYQSEALQYKNFSAWQNKLDFNMHKSYWKTEVENIEYDFDVILDYPRPKVKTYEGKIYSHFISDKGIISNISKLCVENSFTEYNLYFAAYMVLLKVFSLQDGITVGTPFLGRTHPDSYEMLGMFANTLPVSLNIKNSDTIKDIVRKVQEKCSNIFMYQDYPLAQIIEDAHIVTDPSRNPLFDTVFAMQEGNRFSERDDLNGEPIPFTSEISKFDLTLTVSKNSGSEVELSWEYNNILFSEETIERLNNVYINIVKVAQENINSKVEEIDLLDTEKQKVLCDFNNTQVNIDRKHIAQLFEEQVKKNPKNILLDSQGGELTYQSVNEKSNKLANFLIQNGVKSNDIIAVIPNSKIEIVISILGIIKAGAAYLPILPSLPYERIKYMLEDSECKLIVTTRELEDKIKNWNKKYVCLEETENFAANIDNVKYEDDNNIYMIYTSGTSGTPKGVLIKNSNLMNLVNWQIRMGEMDSNTVMLQRSTFMFDAFVWEFFTCILCGGKLQLLAAGLEMEMPYLLKIINEKGVTHALIVPSVFRALVDYCIDFKLNIAESLKKIYLGAEKVSYDLIEKYLSLPGANLNKLVNLYGPTECTVCVTSFDLNTHMGQNIPIGKPIDNTRILILDDKRLCGIGMPGEICIAGKSVSSGYKNRKKLNTEKFVINPYNCEEIIYRTGDIAKWLPDGNILYLGRLDEQVKLRGYRIELEEIKKTIREIPEIRDVAVIVDEKLNGLIAFIKSAKHLHVQTVKNYLFSKLPEYMVPHIIIHINEIPLTPNGKVDKKKLQTLVLDREKGNEIEKPKTDFEKSIVELVSEVLEQKNIGLNSSFFELGGDSIKATRLSSLVTRKLELELKTKDIIKLATIGNIARFLEKQDKIEFNSIPKVKKDNNIFKMTDAQRRLYTLSFMQDNTAYNIPLVYRIDGLLDISLLQNAINLLVDKHEILRTSFFNTDSGFYQKINESCDIEIHQKNVSLLDIEAETSLFIKPFNLSEAPLLRVLVLHVQDKEDILLMDIHHIIFDGGSLNTFLTDLVQAYEKQSLTPLKLQYHDYSEWYDKLLSDDELFWLSEYPEEPEMLELYTDYQRPKVRSFEGDSLIFDLPNNTFSHIEQLKKQLKITEHMFFLSALYVLLNKYTGQKKIIIGTPLSGRIHPDLQDMVGMFVNTLPIQMEVESDCKIYDFLTLVKDKCLHVYDHQSYPFGLLVDKKVKHHDSARNPFFDVMFSYNKSNVNVNRIAGKNMVEVDIHSRISKFDLTFNIQQTGEFYKLQIEYCTELYRKSTIQYLAKHFINIVSEMANLSNDFIAKIRAVSTSEMVSLQRFSNINVQSKIEETVLSLFDKSVRNTPDKIAVGFGNEVITYSELDKRTDCLAHKLLRLGVKHEEFVAVEAIKSINTVVGFLGILKAGAAYVPLDMTYPSQRINFMLEDSDCRFILAQKEINKFDKDRYYIIELNNMDYKNTLESPAELLGNNSPEHMAYLIYTSGTTGKPKGVMIEEKSIVRLVHNVNFIDYSDICILQTGSLAFDACTFEIWGALLNSGTVYLANEHVLLNVCELKDTISKYKINTMFLTTALYNQYISMDANIFDGLKQLLFGGEATSLEHALKLKNKKMYFANVYGPTESTTFASFYPIIGNESGRVPIGKPISNTTAYIFNDNNICGILMPGELYLGGTGLARGYLNRPDLNKVKFVSDIEEIGERVYKTGDLVRWLPDGNIEYLGRIDEQVKIRGFRIEIKEIESCIIEYPLVDEAAVKVCDDPQIGKVLFAYFVSQSLINPDNIKDFIRNKLPSYMIPVAFKQLDSMPITSNGKINKKLLPNLEINSNVQYEAARNLIDDTIIFCVKEILGISNIGINAGFFELGGDSIKATQLAYMLEKKLKIRISTRSILENPIIKNLSDFISESKVEKTYKPIIKQGLKQRYTIGAAQKRIYIVHNTEDNSIAYNIPLVFEVDGKLSLEKFEKALNNVMNQNLILKSYFTNKGEEIYQHIDNNAHASVEYEKFESVKNLNTIIDSFVKPFDLGIAPLLRAKIVDTRINGDTKSIILLDIHHIIFDGMSVPILIEEITKCYEGKVTQISEFILQYFDYTEWSHQHIYDQEAYWLSVYKNGIPNLNLCTDYPRPALRSSKGGHVSITLNGETIEKMHEAINKYGITENMFFMAGFYLLLNKYTHQNEIVIGTPVSGRNHPDIENMIGMFVNTLALKFEIDESATILQYITSLKEMCLNAYENQNYPFDLLIEKLDIVRDMSRNPIFDVMYSYQNNEEKPYIISGMEMHSIDYIPGVSKFDLSLTVGKKGDSSYLVSIEYCVDIFKEKTIEKILEHYVESLNSLLNSDTVISDITLISHKEMLEIESFSNTAKPFDMDLTLNKLLERQAALYPEKVALSIENLRLTYSQLNRRANFVAKYLSELNVKNGDIVAIISNRNIDMIVMIYGILKAGAAYLPILPSYPAERIQYMLSNSAAKVILCCDEILNQCKYDVDAIPFNELRGSEEINPIPLNSSEDLAYVIYTSGTTGKPKGVMVEHKSVINLIDWQTEYGGMTTESVMLQKASFVFDVSVWEIFSTLYCAGMLQLLTDDENIDMELLLKVIIDNKVDHAWFVPSVFRVFLEYIEYNDNLADLKGLNHIYLGGEAVELDLIEKYVKLTGCPKSNLYDLYGPTESTVCVTGYKLKHGVDTYVPIGRPINNTRANIFYNKKPCAIGIPGELCISGICLARGYINNHELTKEKFVVNPINPKEQIYTTGDMVRWGNDGNIEYLGRIDQQVKIRGYRIELEEIERCIREMKGIRQAATKVYENNTKDKFICAYIVTDEDIDENVIKTRLQQQLPEYMIPNYIIKMDNLPTNASGKLDKTTLPNPTFKDKLSHVEAYTEVEHVLVDLWKDVLCIDEIGVTDDFFELGGDSIKAIRLVSLMREKGYRISAQDILREKVIKNIAEVVDKSNVFKYEQHEVVGAMELLPMQKKFFDKALCDPDYFNQSVLLERKETINERILKETLDLMTKHHDALRAIFINGKGFIQTYTQGQNYSLNCYTIKGNITDIAEKIYEFSFMEQSSIEIAKGPLMRVSIFHTDSVDYLLIIIHHLVIDGVSWRILLDDLERVYMSLTGGKSVKLPAKTISVKDWSILLKSKFNEGDFNKEILYWKDKEKQVQQLRLTEKNYSKKEKFERIILDKEITDQIKYNSARTFGAEINDILLTCVARAFCSIYDCKKVAINLESHGREDFVLNAESDRTIGWFTTMYPIVLDGSLQTIHDNINNTKSILQNVPTKGIRYNILSMYSPDITGVEATLTFNYLGEFTENVGKREFKFSDIHYAPNISVNNDFNTEMLFNGQILIDGCMSFEIIYNEEVYNSVSIQNLKKNFIKELGIIADICKSNEINEDYQDYANLSELIFTKFMLDCKEITLIYQEESYNFLFLENLNILGREKVRKSIMDLKKELMPDFIMDMKKYIDFINSKGTLEELYVLTSDSILDNNETIETYCFKNSYTLLPSIMQRLFLMDESNIITGNHKIKGVFTESQFKNRFFEMLEENEVFRAQLSEDRILISQEITNARFYDLRYVDTRVRNSIKDRIQQMCNKKYVFSKEWGYFLCNFIIIHNSEKEWLIYWSAHHCVWDKMSNHIFKEKLDEIFNNSLKRDAHLYSDYIKSIAGVKKEIITGEVESVIKSYIELIEKRKIHNYKFEYVPLNEKSLQEYTTLPWELIFKIVNYIGNKNKLSINGALPVLLLQEDRHYMPNDYTECLGAFLDYLPIVLGETIYEDEIKTSIHTYQNFKKKFGVSVIKELYEKGITLFNIRSLLSVNYQAIYDITEKEISRLLNFKKEENVIFTNEIFITVIGDKLLVGYPIYENCNFSIEELFNY